MVASNDGESVALDLAMSAALIEAGLVREVIRFIQEKRKSDGFEISDRIRIRYNAPAELSAALEANSGHIGEEVLAVEITLDPTLTMQEDELGLTAHIEKV